MHLFSGKIISFPALQKTDINMEVTRLDEKIFVRISRQLEIVNWRAYRKKVNCFKIVQTRTALWEKNPNVSECIAQNIFKSA